MKSVSFDYAFATPHAITLCRPSASEKFIADLTEAGIKFSRTYRTPKDDYPLAWTPHAMDVTFYTDISVGGATASFEKWYRHESGAPCLFAEGSASGISFCMEAIAAKTGVIVKTTVTSEKEEPDYVQIQFAHTNGWVISNQGWIDGVNKNLLLTMNHGRVDRVLALAYGADDYPLYGKSAEEFDHLPPMNDLKLGVAAHSMKKITAYYRLEKGQSKTGYFLMPYENYLCELDALKAIDLEGEMAEALAEWEALLARSARFDIADPTVLHCYRACLADLFVMRERIGEYTGVVCGTRFYRSAIRRRRRRIIRFTLKARTRTAVGSARRAGSTRSGDVSTIRRMPLWSIITSRATRIFWRRIIGECLPPRSLTVRRAAERGTRLPWRSADLCRAAWATAD